MVTSCEIVDKYCNTLEKHPRYLTDQEVRDSGNDVRELKEVRFKSRPERQQRSDRPRRVGQRISKPLRTFGNPVQFLLPGKFQGSSIC